MKDRDASEKLKRLIAVVEAKKKMEFLQLKAGVTGMVDTLKPSNLLASTLQEFSKPEIKEKLVGSALSLAAGYLLRKLVVGKSNSPMRKVTGYLVQWAVSKIMARKL